MNGRQPVTTTKLKRSTVCSVDGCGQIYWARGFCHSHYNRARRTGAISKVTPEERFWASVNKTDNCWEWTGLKYPKGYGSISVGGRMVYAHRLSYEINVSPIPKGMHVDHICFNKSCVNPEHLRLATPKQNKEHQNGAYSTNKSSGVRGVTWDKNRNAWHGQVGHNGRNYHCGLFSTIAEAEAAVIAKRLELFTHSDPELRVAA